jgi:hypothetical protein
MRTLIVSDIHGNAAALEAVLSEPHDTVACHRDIVGCGPEPAACLRLLRLPSFSAQDAWQARMRGRDRSLSGSAPGTPPAEATWPLNGRPQDGRGHSS